LLLPSKEGDERDEEKNKEEWKAEAEQEQGDGKRPCKEDYT